MSLCLQDNYGNDRTRHERNEMMKKKPADDEKKPANVFLISFYYFTARG